MIYTHVLNRGVKGVKMWGDMPTFRSGEPRRSTLYFVGFVGKVMDKRIFKDDGAVTKPCSVVNL